MSDGSEASGPSGMYASSDSETTQTLNVHHFAGALIWNGLDVADLLVPGEGHFSYNDDELENWAVHSDASSLDTEQWEMAPYWHYGTRFI